LRYRDLLARGAPFSALAAFGGIVNVLPQLSARARALWIDRLMLEPLGPELVDHAAGEASRERERMRRIGSVGESWEWEELVLLVTSRVQLDLVAEALHFAGHTPKFDLMDVDELLNRIAKSRANAGLYASARDQCRRNWGLPISSRWLEQQ
jgi:hypothetical protein